MKHSYYDFVSFIMFNINYSNIYRLGKLLVNSSNLLWLTPHIVRELTYQYIVFINSEILILIPCKLPFIGPWCDLSGATKKTAIERLTLLMLKRNSRKAFRCTLILFSIINVMQPSAQRKHINHATEQQKSQFVWIQNLFKTALVASN